MTKVEYHIYLSITEIVLSRFKKSNYVTFKEYHKGLYRSLCSNVLLVKEKTDIDCIFDHIDVIYSMTQKTSGEYIFNYFSLDEEKVELFEKIVRIREKLNIIN